MDLALVRLAMNIVHLALIQDLTHANHVFFRTSLIIKHAHLIVPDPNGKIKELLATQFALPATKLVNFVNLQLQPCVLNVMLDFGKKTLLAQSVMMLAQLVQVLCLLNVLLAVWVMP